MAAEEQGLRLRPADGGEEIVIPNAELVSVAVHNGRHTELTFQTSTATYRGVISSLVDAAELIGLIRGAWGERIVLMKEE